MSESLFKQLKNIGTDEELAHQVSASLSGFLDPLAMTARRHGCRSWGKAGAVAGSNHDF